MGKANGFEGGMDKIIGRAIYDRQPGMPPQALKEHYRHQMMNFIDQFVGFISGVLDGDDVELWTLDDEAVQALKNSRSDGDGTGSGSAKGFQGMAKQEAADAEK